MNIVSIIAPIFVLTAVIIQGVRFAISAYRHRTEIDKLDDSSTKRNFMLHNNEHLAGVLLLLVSGTVMLLTMVLSFIAYNIFGHDKLDVLIVDVMYIASSVYFLSNIWYISHLIKEENGPFKYSEKRYKKNNKPTC